MNKYKNPKQTAYTKKQFYDISLSPTRQNLEDYFAAISSLVLMSNLLFSFLKSLQFKGLKNYFFKIWARIVATHIRLLSSNHGDNMEGSLCVSSLKSMTTEQKKRFNDFEPIF